MRLRPMPGRFGFRATEAAAVRSPRRGLPARLSVAGTGAVAAFGLTLAGLANAAETIAFWPFDEPVGLYPSSVLSDHGPNACTLILGPGGSVAPGKFGNALTTQPQPAVVYPSGSVLFGLTQLPPPAGRTVEPMSWMNAKFTALITAGETHLRKEAPQPNPAGTGLNLGSDDWTAEFWYRPSAAASGPSEEGVIFELGAGPRGENDHVTALLLAKDRRSFVIVNQPAATRAHVPTDSAALAADGRWSHLAFVWDARAGALTHYVNGRRVGSPVPAAMKPVETTKEAYFSIGRGARWDRALPGALDELRISRGIVYASDFTPPGSLVVQPDAGAPAQKPGALTALRFANPAGPAAPVALGTSKHLLIDDALFPRPADVSFVPTPPTKVELVLEITAAFRKHVVAIDGGDGSVRLYAPVGKEDRLGVWTSRDGVHFEAPKLSGAEPGYTNAVTAGSAGTPAIFIDPLAPPAERWKLVSGDEGRGIFVHTSPDGLAWKKLPTAAVSAASASQPNMFYDDQRGQYVAYLRTDIGRNAYGRTERRFVMATVDSVRPPWPFSPKSQADYDRETASLRLGAIKPWYLDNGPLTPGGVGIEWPTVFRPTEGFDQTATDMYVPKAVKYPFAPDAYLAFPCIYYHYEGAQPATRAVLGERERDRGSGPIETQLMTSRDGVTWKRYPRPVWMGVGLIDGLDVHQTYMAQGVIRRGDEIWMYSFNTEEYHSSGRKKVDRRGIFRTVQRLDRFVAAEAPYDRAATMISRPLTFTGRRLVLNVDTGASGFVQVGFQRPDGTPVKGFAVDDCVYVNGNELRYGVEWAARGTDLSSLAGETLQMVIRLRGARLYSLEFSDAP